MRVHTLRLLIAALVLGFSGQALAFALAPGSIEAHINNESIQFELDKPVAGTSNLHINMGALHTQQHDDGSATVLTAGFQGVETDNRTFRAAVGTRLYAYSAPNSNSGAALAFGGLFYHILPGASHVSLGAYGWAAPQVTSFGDTEYIYELGGRIAYRVIQNTDVFLGYRNLYLKSDDKSFRDSIEDGFHIGFRLNF